MTKKLCAHGKETWERCRPCEVDILTGKSTGFTPAQAPSKEWSVTVESNAETLLTISSQHVAGRELSDADEVIVRMAAGHLLAFVGEPCSADEPPAEQPSATEIIRQMKGRAADSEGGSTIEVLLSDLRSVVTGMLARPALPPAPAPRFQVGQEVFAGCAVRNVLAISNCYKLSNTICEGSGWTMFDENSVEPCSWTTKEGK